MCSITYHHRQFIAHILTQKIGLDTRQQVSPVHMRTEHVVSELKVCSAQQPLYNATYWTEPSNGCVSTLQAGSTYIPQHAGQLVETTSTDSHHMTIEIKIKQAGAS